MTELHLVLILVYTGKVLHGYTASGTVTTVEVQKNSRPGTYCRYERGVTVYEPELTVKCPQVFVDEQGHIHARRAR